MKNNIHTIMRNMMTHRVLTISLLTTLWLGLGAPLTTGAEPSRQGTVGAQFLKIGVGARYLAMGEAAVASKGDAFSMYWNPAAMTETEGQQIGFAHTDWLLDVTLNYIAYQRRFEGKGVLGVAMTSMSVPKMEITTVDEQEGTGQSYDASSFALQVGFARELTPRFSFGGAAKYVHERIFRETSSAIAFDFGTMLYTGFRTLRLGMNISNLGGDVRYDGPNLTTNVNDNTNDNGVTDPSSPDVGARLLVESYSLPLTFRVGMGYDWEFNAGSRLTMAAEMKHPNNAQQQGSLGMEYGWHERFFLRSGYKFQYDEQGLTLGGGIMTPIFGDTEMGIDYAWSDFGRLSSAHRFSVTMGF